MVTVAEAVQIGGQRLGAGRLAEAEKIFRDVLDVDPDNAQAVHFLGLALVQQRRSDEGLPLLARSVELDADNPRMHSNYAGVLSQEGDLDAARHHFTRAVELDPTYAQAYSGLAQNMKGSPDDGVLEAIEAQVKGQGPSRDDKVLLHFAAGKLADDRGEFDRAFDHFERANAWKQARYDRAEVSQTAERSIEVFTPEFFAERKGWGSDDQRPVFIIGMPRSGTTLLEQVLARHPEVIGAGELPFVSRIVQAIPGGSYPTSVEALAAPDIAQLAAQYSAQLDSLAPGAARVTDKQPGNFLFAGMIALLFPGARVLHCRRHPVDTALSCFFQNFNGGQNYSFALDDLVHFTRRYQALMAHWSDVLSTPMLDVAYEGLVTEPERTAREVVAFCGLEWDDACLDHTGATTTVQTASRWQVRQPVYTSSVERWRRYEAHLGPLRDLL